MKQALAIARVFMVLGGFVPVLVAEDNRNRQIDAIFDQWEKPTAPGAAVAVIERGRIVFEKAYGMADLEHHAPNTPQTIFNAGSVAKQFTAMAVVLLEQDGKLSLDDDVRKYLPELPDYGSKITIRNLLQHESGIRDEFCLLALAGWNLDVAACGDVTTHDQALRLLFRQKELNFRPGEKWQYSNSGYTLAAEIVTRVSGKPFPEFCEERIFRPLEMSHTHFHDDLSQVVPDRALPYVERNGGYAIANLNNAIIGSSNLHTTAGDLVKWLDNFREPKVGGAAAVARIRFLPAEKWKEVDFYGLGIMLSTYRGLHTMSHDGYIGGFQSYVLWFPDQQLGVAVVSNVQQFNPHAASEKVAALYLGEKMTPLPSEPKPEVHNFISVGSDVLKKYVGVYPVLPIKEVEQFVMENGKLCWGGVFQPPIELQPIAANRFYVQRIEADIEFTPESAGGMKVQISQPGGVNEGQRTGFTLLNEVELQAYAAVYSSDELDTQYTLFVRDGKLYGAQMHLGEFALAPVKEDQFATALWFMPQIKFIRDNSGKITGAVFGGGRVKGVHFARKQ